jgi:putative aldouronate transport system substrate-binding protein
MLYYGKNRAPWRGVKTPAAFPERLGVALNKTIGTVLLAAALFFAPLQAFAQSADPLGKYDPEITVHFARCYDNTLNDNYFAQNPNTSLSDNLWIDLYREKLGIRIVYDWIVKDGDEYEQKLNLSIVSGNIPEFFNVSALQLRQLAEADMILPLDELYETYASDFTKQVLTKGGPEPFDAATINGKLYGLPVTATDKEVDYLWIRTDWLDKLHLAVPTTMDELVSVARAFAAADFDGNGIADTYGPVFTYTFWDGFGSLKGFFNAYDAYPGIWVEQDGKLIYGSLLPGCRDALEKLHEMYELGLIDPEFGVKEARKVAELTATGHAGIEYGAQWNSIWPLQASKDAEPGAQWQAVPIVTGTDHTAKVQSNLTTDEWTVVRKNAANPEAVVKMYNLYIDTNWGPDNQNDVYYAPMDSESIWKLSPVCPEMPNKNLDAFLVLQEARETGDISKIQGEAMSIYRKLQLFQTDPEKGFALWGWERIYGQQGAYKIYKQYLDEDRIVFDRYTAAPTEAMSNYLSTLKEIQNELFTQIILGQASIDAFDQFVAEFNELGGRQITDEVNAWYQNEKGS